MLLFCLVFTPIGFSVNQIIVIGVILTLCGMRIIAEFVPTASNFKHTTYKGYTIMSVTYLYSCIIYTVK